MCHWQESAELDRLPLAIARHGGSSSEQRRASMAYYHPPPSLYLLLPRRDTEAQEHPVLSCRLYTRLTRPSPCRKSPSVSNLVSVPAGGLPSSSLKHTRTKVTHLCLDNTNPSGLWDQALRLPPQVRLTVSDGFARSQQLRYRGNTNRMRLQRPRKLNPALGRSQPLRPNRPSSHPTP